MSSDNESKDLINENLNKTENTQTTENSRSNPSTILTENKPKQKNTHLMISFIVVIAGIITISSLLLYFNTSTKRFYRAYDAGELSKSAEIYQKSSDMANAEITGFLLEEANKLEKLYLNNLISYQDYLNSMEIIIAILPSNETINTSVSYVNSIETDRNTLVSANKLFDEKKYIEALNILQAVKENSPEYKNAQILTSKATSSLETEVTSEINNLILNKQVAEAISYNESVKQYISEEAYNKNREILQYQANQLKLSILNAQLTQLEADYDILYTELYINEEEGKYGLLTITNDKQPTNLDKDNKKYGLTPVLNNKSSYYLADDELTLKTLLEAYAYMPRSGASGFPAISILDSGNNSLLINNSYNYNAVSFNTYYELSTEVKMTSIHNDYSKRPSVHNINDTLVSEHEGLSTKESFLKYDKTQKIKIFWKSENNNTLNYYYFPEDTTKENLNYAKNTLAELLD